MTVEKPAVEREESSHGHVPVAALAAD